jgi:hypothetical protein
MNLRVLPLGACVLSLLLARPSLAKEESVASGSYSFKVQLIGWSQDEQRFALRVFSEPEVFEGIGSDDEDDKKPKDPWMGEDGFCKGYVDHQGKPFSGSLALHVFERGKRVARLPIQDEGKCTPPKKAAERLAEAKKKLAALGVDLALTGTEFLSKAGTSQLDVKQGERAPYTLRIIDEPLPEKEPEDGEDMVWFRTTLKLLLQRGDKQTPLWEKKINKKHSIMSGYQHFVSHVYVSPSAGQVALLTTLYQGDMRDRKESVWISSIVDIPSEVPVKVE